MSSKGGEALLPEEGLRLGSRRGDLSPGLGSREGGVMLYEGTAIGVVDGY